MNRLMNTLMTIITLCVTGLVMLFINFLITNADADSVVGFSKFLFAIIAGGLNIMLWTIVYELWNN